MNSAANEWGVRGWVCAGERYNFLNAIIKHGKIQSPGLSTRLQISIPPTAPRRDLIPWPRGFGGGVGPPPTPAHQSAHPASRLHSGHSRFLHGLPPLATGVGDVGAAAVHGAWLAAAPPRAQTARSSRPGGDPDGGSGRGPVAHSRARSTCALPGRWQRRRTRPEPWVSQLRASRCAAGAWRRGARGGDRWPRRRRCRLYQRRGRGAARRWGGLNGGGASAACLESRPGSRAVAPRPVTVAAAPWVREAPPRCSRGFPDPGCFPPGSLGSGLRSRYHQLPLGYAAASCPSRWSRTRSRHLASSGLALRCLPPLLAPAE